MAIILLHIKHVKGLSTERERADVSYSADHVRRQFGQSTHTISALAIMAYPMGMLRRYELFFARLFY